MQPYKKLAPISSQLASLIPSFHLGSVPDSCVSIADTDAHRTQCGKSSSSPVTHKMTYTTLYLSGWVFIVHPTRASKALFGEEGQSGPRSLRQQTDMSHTTLDACRREKHDQSQKKVTCRHIPKKMSTLSLTLAHEATTDLRCVHSYLLTADFCLSFQGKLWRCLRCFSMLFLLGFLVGVVQRIPALFQKDLNTSVMDISDVKTSASIWVVGTHIICTTKRVLHQIPDYQSVDVGLPFLGYRSRLLPV